MSDEIIFRSPYPPIEIPEISSGEYFYKKLKNYGDRTILVSKIDFRLIKNNIFINIVKNDINKFIS